MRLYLSTVILTLAWFSTLNIMSSALVWLIVRELRRFPDQQGKGRIDV